MKKKRLFILLPVLMLALGACEVDLEIDSTISGEESETETGDSSSETSPTPSNPALEDIKLTLDADATSVTVGTTITLTAVTDPEGASIAYSSSNTSVATVSDSGVVTTLAVGEVTITATAALSGYNSATAFIKITVTAASSGENPGGGPSEGSDGRPNRSLDSHTYVVPMNEEDTPIIFNVDVNGTAYNNKGAFTVGIQENTFDNPTCTYKDEALYLDWTPAATAGVINWNAVTIGYELPTSAGFDNTIGAAYTITLDIYTEVACTVRFDTINHELTAGWNTIEAEQGKVGIVDTVPNFTMYFAPGNEPTSFPQTNTVYISYLAFDYTPHLIPATDIQIDESYQNIELHVGESIDLASYITILPANTTDSKDYTITLSDSSGTYVELNGTVLTAKEITSEPITITVSLGSLTPATATIEVVPIEVTSIKFMDEVKEISLVLSEDKIDLAPYIVVEPSNATYQDYELTLSEGGGTYIELDGTTISGKAVTDSPVTITVSLGGHSDSIQVSVVEGTIPVTGIEIDEGYTEISMEVDSSIDMSEHIHVLPVNATNQTYTITLSDEDETYVKLEDDGHTITAVSPTEEAITLTASIETYEATASITVNSPALNPDIDHDEDSTHTYTVPIWELNDDCLVSSQNPFGSDGYQNYGGFTYMYMDAFITGTTWFENERLNMSWSLKSGATGTPWSAITLVYKLPSDHAMPSDQGADFKATLHIYVEKACFVYMDNTSHYLNEGMNVIQGEASNYGSAPTTPDFSLYFGVEAQGYVCTENTIYIDYLAFDWTPHS